MAQPSDRFRQAISYALIGSRDAYGALALGALEQAPARVQPTNRTIVDANGVETVVSRIIYTAAPITLAHRIWLPEDTPGDSQRMRRPIRVDPEVDGNGNVRFRKVWL